MKSEHYERFFLKTVRLGFSVWSEEDILDALELWGNSEVTKFIASNGKMSEDQIHERLKKEIENYNKFKVQYWPIYLIETNENVGCCGLRPYDLEKNIFEMGIHLKDKYWGKGFAKEACSAVIEYAFNTLGVEALFAGHNPKNTASAQLLKKLGFTYTQDEFYPPTGLYHPSYLMARQVLSKEQNEMVSRLTKALQVLKGKQVLIDTSGGIMTNQLYKNFDYKFFENCEKENLLDFQDEDNEETPTICIKIDDIYHIIIDDNVDEHYIKVIKIELTNEFTIRLELQR